MIKWNDIAKGQIPKKNQQVLWHPSFEFGCIGENGIVYMDSNEGHWVDIAHGFEVPNSFRPSNIVRYWTEANEPEDSL